MLEQLNGEQAGARDYVEEYLDCVESLPCELQREVSLLRELDSRHQVFLSDIEACCLLVARDGEPVSSEARHQALEQARCALLRSEQLRDEQLQLAAALAEVAETRARRLQSWAFPSFGVTMAAMESSPFAPDKSGTRASSLSRQKGSGTSLDQDITARGEMHQSTISTSTTTTRKRSRRRGQHIEERENGLASSPEPREKKPRSCGTSSNNASNNSGRKKRKRSRAKRRSVSPTIDVDIPIDPDEPTYCLCEQVSYGEMIGCDNPDCPIEWFHFACVGLRHKPKGRWFCPKCRGDSEKTMVIERPVVVEKPAALERAGLERTRKAR
uniref:inhibitor of growth protein 1-like n=1 Tax=Myxine glutinosa TaxID=7769 RepID=UPI00358F0A2D